MPDLHTEGIDQVMELAAGEGAQKHGFCPLTMRFDFAAMGLRNLACDIQPESQTSIGIVFVVAMRVGADRNLTQL